MGESRPYLFLLLGMELLLFFAESLKQQSMYGVLALELGTSGLCP